MKSNNERCVSSRYLLQTARVVAAFLFSLLVLSGALGCSGDDGADKSDGGAAFGDELAKDPRARFDNLSESGLQKITFDLNADGLPDQFHYKKGAALVRVVRDLNFDGLPDCYEHYGNGSLLEEEMDLDLDGAIDVVRFYEGGLITRKRYAVGFRADMVIGRWYEQGELVRVERDTNGKGQVDRWEHYQPGSPEPFKIEIDENGDGRPDRTLSSS